MDITAVLTAAAPAEGVPAAPAKDAGDAFAGLLATAMTETPPILELPVCPTPVSLPPVCPMPVALPPVCPTPTSTLGATVTPVPPEKGSDPVPIAEPAEAAGTVPERGAKPSTAARGRPKIPAPPEPPPTLAVAPVSEKEAPTTAPNAPVTPLDRTSEEESALQSDPVPEAPALPASAALVAQVVSTTAVPAAVRDTTAKPVAATVVVPAVATVAKTPVTKDRPVVSTAQEPKGTVDLSPTSPDRVESLNDTEEPSVGTRPPSAEFASSPARQTLESAPDLDIVPQVVPTTQAAPIISADRVRDAAPVANVQVASVAAKSEAPAVEKPSAKTADSQAPEFAAVVAVASEKKNDGQEGGDDAPNDPTPQPTAAPTVKTAATERPDAGTDRPAVDRHLVVRQVADRIESLVASRPRDGVTIHLEPRDLGTVTLVVKGIASALDVQVSASDDRVRQSIDSSRPELAQALAPRGIQVRELRVAASSATTGSATDSNRNPNPNPEGRPRQGGPTTLYPRASRPEASASRRPSRNGRGVDLLV